ncbi:protein Lines homolog 1 isoform X2 [Kryptolebias marmoratus]|uniref:protein Lines homolog 1 isoform X2 n=1 Tax=Kryptolebias marmoratus TaxID=37003 RepID=UPI0018AC8EEF|nr:protein Lines homolog 1 isoform X2 [Kryptolebias marmoratus]
MSPSGLQGALNHRAVLHKPPKNTRRRRKKTKMAASMVHSSHGELLRVLTDVYRGFLSGFCPEPNPRDVAVLIQSAVCGRVPGEDTRWELTSVGVSLVRKLSWSLVLQNLPAESADSWEQVLKVLLEDLGLMSELVRLLRAEDQLIAHLAAKTAAGCVSFLLCTSGQVSPAWQETCVQAFSSSCPAPQDACLWSLTELLKKLLQGSDPAIVGNLVTSFDFSLRIFCSQLLSEPRTEPASWETTFCLLLDLLEVLTASRFISGPGICRSPPLVQPSALLRTISCSSQNFVKNRTLLLLKRVLLQKVGEDWSLRGPRSEDLNSDPRVLAQSVLAAVKDGWLHTVHVEPGGFFGGTRPVRGDEGEDSVSEVCGYVHRLWDFLSRFSGSLRVDHLCCWVRLLFEEQDDDLMEAARTCLSLFLSSRRRLGPDGDDGVLLERACGSGFNPHCHFLLLLQSFSFDHSVLLDFLISSETCFLEYFVRYLKYLRGSWTGFTAACGSGTEPRDQLSNGGSEHVLRPGEGSSSGPRLVDYDSSDESGPEPAEDSSVGEGTPVEPKRQNQPTSAEPSLRKPQSSSLLSVQDERTGPGERPLLRQAGSETMDRAVLCPSETLDRAVLSPSGTLDKAVLSPSGTLDRTVLSPSETLDRTVLSPSETLDRAVLCLLELRQVVLRLQMKKLFPYNPSSLLKLLTEVEDSYGRSRLSLDSEEPHQTRPAAEKFRTSL